MNTGDRRAVEQRLGKLGAVGQNAPDLKVQIHLQLLTGVRRRREAWAIRSGDAVAAMVRSARPCWATANSLNKYR